MRKQSEGVFMKKLLSKLFITFLFVCVVSNPVMAEENITALEQEQVYTISVLDASDMLISKIEETGVVVDSESVIQLLPVSSETGEDNNSALVITNTDGNIVTKDVLLLVTDEGVGFKQTSNSDASICAGTTVEFPPLSWDGRYVIRGTAVYNQYSDGLFSSYYQPIGAYFTYVKYETCTVSNITMLYICDGFEYSYPGIEDLGLDEIEYVVSVSQVSPNVSTMYSTTKQYNTNRVICTASGSPMVGQFLTFNTVVDGVSDGFTVTI